jgi:hypothetical protein
MQDHATRLLLHPTPHHECIALSHLRSRFQHLFWHGCAMSSFMSQDAQRDVMYFVTDCLQFHLENAPGV